MPLADDIRALRDRTLAELTAAHDYYTDTITAWSIVQEAVAGGRAFNTLSDVTGTATTQADLVTRSTGYVTDQLVSATFQQFISTFEAFVFDLLRLWLTAHPRSLVGRKVEFEAVLDAADKAGVVQGVVDEELGRVLYKRPAEWFAYLNEKVKLGRPTPDEVGRVAEAKATRDVLVHNRGVATEAYVLKAGPFARHADGEFVELPERYHRGTWALLRAVVADVSDAAAAKA